MFDYEIERVFSTHSFGRYQLSVVKMCDQSGKDQQGIAVYPIPVTLYSEARYIEAVGTVGKPLPMDKIQILKMCAFLKEVLNESLPKRLEIKFSDLTLDIQIKKVLGDQPHDTSYKGNVGVYRSRAFKFLPRASISRNSLMSLSKSMLEISECK